ncbi:MAG: redox-sensing transcriptional repressor Rex [Erysipelotrichaceae bacterium]|nr:redox-sensing transcriptional repressor Rex [Erysipelotrichaceae bacterium]
MNKTPNPTLRRYPVYLKALRKIKEEGKEKIMSSELAAYVNIKPTTIRRDFSLIGSLGKQGYGYNVDELIDIFSKELGVNYDEKIILVGAGNLGRAMLNYNRWSNVVGEIVCAFDIAPEKCGSLPIPVYHISDIKEKLPQGCRIAILCISDNDVQETVDLLADAGIKGIVDFTYVHYNNPEGVIIRSVDVVSMIQELVFETNSENR